MPDFQPFPRSVRERLAGWFAAAPWLRRFLPRPSRPMHWRRARTPFRSEMPPSRRLESLALRVRRSLLTLVLIVARNLTRLPPHKPGVDERIEVTVEYAIHVAQCQLASQVLYQPVRREYIVADLAAEVDLQLGVLSLAGLLALLLHLVFVEARAQLLHGAVAILVLRPLVLALHHDAGRKVRDAHRGIGHVDVLPAGA